MTTYHYDIDCIGNIYADTINGQIRYACSLSWTFDSYDDKLSLEIHNHGVNYINFKTLFQNTYTGQTEEHQPQISD